MNKYTELSRSIVDEAEHECSKCTNVECLERIETVKVCGVVGKSGTEKTEVSTEQGSSNSRCEFKMMDVVDIAHKIEKSECSIINTIPSKYDWHYDASQVIVGRA